MTIEEQRIAKRDYMRQYRADPRNRETERRCQERAARSRKIKRALQASAREVARAEKQRRMPRCWFGCKRKPIETIDRLVLRPIHGHNQKWEFVSEKVPYCGIC
jgi:hypothetical protein